MTPIKNQRPRVDAQHRMFSGRDSGNRSTCKPYTSCEEQRSAHSAVGSSNNENCESNFSSNKKYQLTGSKDQIQQAFAQAPFLPLKGPKEIQSAANSQAMPLNQCFGSGRKDERPSVNEFVIGNPSSHPQQNLISPKEAQVQDLYYQRSIQRILTPIKPIQH